MKEILLSQGKVALVDDEDYEHLNQYRWAATKGGRTYYAKRSVWLGNGKQKSLKMERFILNAPKGIQVDHEDHNGLNNQRYNIRLASVKQNGYNRQKQTGLSSKYKGVHWNKLEKKWRVNIMLNQKQMHLGCFVEEIEAALAYDKAAKIYFGEFAYLNFPVEK